jgi:S-adenosylmethionine:tRNA ribosyltransferase-isomerase
MENFAFVPRVHTEEYRYDLPPERIAAYPLDDRAGSKLLVAALRQQRSECQMEGQIECHTECHTECYTECYIEHHGFRNITTILPSRTLLVMNDSRVIAARIQMQKPTGGAAEVLCLQSLHPSHDPAVAMLECGSSTWLCMVGGRNVKKGTTLHLERNGIRLEARIVERSEQSSTEALVRFSWQPEHLSFAEWLDICGEVPLPPYIKRSAEASDKERYQTVYAKHEGSVAAPTAGLHFTNDVLQALERNGVRTERVTLHVGAGTFKPMTSSEANNHTMHYERICVARRTIEMLIAQREDALPLVAVGTTSVRTLESLYWWGVRLLANDGNAQAATELTIAQWDAYRMNAEFPTLAAQPMPNAATALRAVLAWMQQHELQLVEGETQLMIMPGYRFQLCDALITNFHQPASTLMLLVAAFLSDEHGTSHWRTVYDAALAEQYRFLSYGDSSLLIANAEYFEHLFKANTAERLPS